jgi:hypothetical protein
MINKLTSKIINIKDWAHIKYKMLINTKRIKQVSHAENRKSYGGNDHMKAAANGMVRVLSLFVRLTYWCIYS